MVRSKVKKARVILRQLDGRPALPDSVAMNAFRRITDASNRAIGVRLNVGMREVKTEFSIDWSERT